MATATGNHLPIAESQTRFCCHYRAENLCYRFDHGQKLLPQFRKIIGLVIRLGGTPTPDFMPLFWQPQQAITCPLRRAKLGLAATTAPKIFAINLVTDKNSCHNPARLSAWCFDWVGHPHPKTAIFSEQLRQSHASVNSCAQSTLGLPLAWLFLVLHLNIAVLQLKIYCE